MHKEEIFTIYSELAYGTKNRNMIYKILEGEYKDKLVIFHSIKSYDGEIDQIVVQDIENDKLIYISDDYEITKIKERCYHGKS